MLIGPVFSRELVTTPRRSRHYVFRTVYVVTLLTLVCTAWLVVAGTQIIRNVGDMARFGGSLFQVLAPLQLALITFLAALSSASAVAQEKDRRTLLLLLLTRLTNSELVLGKMLASLLDVLTMLAVATPLFLCVTLFGGVAPSQVWRVMAVTLASALAAGSLGSTLALWRERTFQTLAMTALGIVFWLAVGEVVGGGFLFSELAGQGAATWGVMLSPFRAILAASRPVLDTASTTAAHVANVGAGVTGFLGLTSLGVVLLNAIAIWRVRVWNPSRELQPVAPTETAESETASESAAGESAAGVANRGVRQAAASSDERARLGHVDARVRTTRLPSRRVWDNPVLWREICTWAYGRKVLVIRLAYAALFALTVAGLYYTVGNASPDERGDELATVIPLAARPLTPFFLVSIVIINALAVTSITGERDGGALDLLLVTDLSPREFVLGKLGGVLYVTWPMTVLPIVLSTYLWRIDGITTENYVYLFIGLIMMYVFAATLGIHCGMTYASSRSAIGLSIGTVFFLFLGILTCMVMMVSFSGSFQTQLAPFLMVILGGSLGLYVSLGSRNPSPAIGLASLLLPFVTFYAITSYALQNYLTVFLVTIAVYGFTTAAMLVPAVAQFDIAMGRTKTAGEE